MAEFLALLGYPAMVEDVAELADEPNGAESERLLRYVTEKSDVELLNSVRLELGSVADEPNEGRENLFPDEVTSLSVRWLAKTMGGKDNVRETHELEHAEDSVDVPTLVRSKPLGSEGDLRCHTELELVIGRLKEDEELADHNPDVGLVGQRVAELERPTADRDVSIAEAVEDNGPVPLDGVGVHADDLVKSVEGDVTVMLCQQESGTKHSLVRLTGCCYRGCRGTFQEC